MKRLIVFILFILSTAAFAQEVAFKSKIVLKDGSELHVVIIENVPGKYIKILIPGETITTIDYANIVSIKHKNYDYDSGFELKRGLNFQASSSLLFGKQNEYSGRGGLVLSAVSNYRLNYAVNLGLGVDPTVITGYLLLPIYFRFSGNFSNKKISTVYAVDMGWSLARSNNDDFAEVATDGGWFARPGIGMRFNKVAIMFSYQIQSITTTSVIADWLTNDTRTTVENRLMKNMLIGFAYNF